MAFQNQNARSAIFFRRIRRPICKWLAKLFAAFWVFLYFILSLYGVWGWITLADIRKYCEKERLDYHEVVNGMIADVSTKTGVGINDMSVQIRHTDEPIYKWVVPFMLMRSTANGPEFIHGGMLEPLLILSDNTANGVCSLAIGCLISLVILMVEILKEKNVPNSRLILRPIAGALGAFCTYLIILSGGSIIWNQVAGVSGLSLGVMSAIGAIYVEKLQKFASFTV